jgi:ribosomal protein S18 acetylase RimI-like enzyme
MPTRPIVVRPARPEDAEAVTAMTAQLSEDEGGQAPSFSSEAFRRDGFGHDPAFECLVAELEGKPCGYVLTTPHYDTDSACRGVYVCDLFVERGVRRLGIGRKLMVAVAEAAAARGGSYLVWAVRRHNDTARLFYGAVGHELSDVLLCCADGEAFDALARPGRAMS